MNRRLFLCALSLGILLTSSVFLGVVRKSGDGPATETAGLSPQSIHGRVGRGETFFEIFKRHGLNMQEFFAIKEAAASAYRLRDIHGGQPYAITIDDDKCVESFVYWIDDDSLLKIDRMDRGFHARKCDVRYTRKVITVTGAIEDNLISAVGSGRENLVLALKLSDIFAWDIDFASDIRRGDTFTLVVEGLYLGNSFKKYGEILFGELINNGNRHIAYRFVCDEKEDYYDGAGNSLRKAFLRAPLSFRRISSTFSGRRFHPVLKIYRPHRGVDYSASAGTPVTSTGDGAVVFAGYKGQYGKLVAVGHRNGYTTYYGHLSRIGKGILRGAKVRQGDVIGYVGATGLATGPHLHYEMRRAGRHVNPLTVSVSGDPVPPSLKARFAETAETMDRIVRSLAVGNASLPVMHGGRRQPEKGERNENSS